MIHFLPRLSYIYRYKEDIENKFRHFKKVNIYQRAAVRVLYFGVINNPPLLAGFPNARFPIIQATPSPTCRLHERPQHDFLKLLCRL